MDYEYSLCHKRPTTFSWKHTNNIPPLERHRLLKVRWPVRFWSLLVSEQDRGKNNTERGSYDECSAILLFFMIHTNNVLHTPVEELQGHSVSIVVRNHVDSLVDQTQVGHQSLHHTGLLKDRVLVWSLRCSGTGENKLSAGMLHQDRNICSDKWIYLFESIQVHPQWKCVVCCWHIFYSLACHWSQTPGSPVQRLDGSAAWAAPRSVSKDTQFVSGRFTQQQIPQKIHHFSITLALVHWLSTEHVQRVPYSSRSWMWGNRGAERGHLSCLKHHKSLVWGEKRWYKHRNRATRDTRKLLLCFFLQA